MFASYQLLVGRYSFIAAVLNAAACSAS